MLHSAVHFPPGVRIAVGPRRRYPARCSAVQRGAAPRRIAATRDPPSPVKGERGRRGLSQEVRCTAAAARAGHSRPPPRPSGARVGGASQPLFV